MVDMMLHLSAIAICANALVLFKHGKFAGAGSVTTATKLAHLSCRNRCDKMHSDKLHWTGILYSA